MNSSIKYIVIALLIVGGVSCRQRGGKEVAQSTHSKECVESLCDVAMGYWNHFDLRDTTLIGSANLRQAFINYSVLLGKITPSEQALAIDSLCSSALRSEPKLFDEISWMAEQVLYEPNSPLRNDEIYLLFLESIIELPSLAESHKIRPRYLIDIVSQNRVGSPAADFGFTLSDDTESSLGQVEGDYIILFFSNPDCNDCKRVKGILSNINEPHITILSIYPDSDLELWRRESYPTHFVNARSWEVNKLYDLKAIPTLYLLDSEHRVLLKDGTIESIIATLGL